MDWALASLAWLVELGADEAIGEAPVDRYARAAEPVAARVAAPVAPPAPAPAAEPQDLAALAAAMEAAPTDLRRGARAFVFADGTAGAPLMVVGEAPGRDDEATGRPWSGPTGALLDLMLAAIGRAKTDADPPRAVYLTNLLPWRLPVGGRGPSPADVALFAPFLRRHVELARPRAVLLLGNAPLQALLGRGQVTQARGTWAEVAGVPALPSLHPSYLLNRPTAKREAWMDLLSLKARLDRGV